VVDDRQLLAFADFVTLATEHNKATLKDAGMFSEMAQGA
jgi:hypothetical protein